MPHYSGDTNYPAVIGSPAYVNVNDFTIGMNANSITVAQGQSQTIGVNIQNLGAFSGNVGNFSCSGLPAETTCSFSPATVAGGDGTSTLTVTTTPSGQMRHRAENESHRIGWMAIAIFPLLGICLIGIPSWPRRGVLPLMAIVALLLTLPSCGGGGGTPVVNNPVPAITSLSPTQQAAGSTSQAVTIAGSGFISDSTVTYNNVAHAATYTSASQLAISLTTADMAATGSFPLVVTNPTPGGGTSSAVNFNVVSGTPVGSFNVIVTGTSGSLTHTTNFTLTIN